MAQENFSEHDVDGTPENSHPPEAQESENDSGGGGEKKWPGWPGENVFRMLVPVQKVGRLLGCKGECITKICKETKARIRIIDGPPGTTEAAVMVSAKEEPDIPIPPALECLLRLHKHVIDGDGDPVVYTRLLVVTTRAAHLIGKQEATIKSIEDASSCTISISGEENLPVFALPDDRVVEIRGKPTGVHKAVELIASYLRRFLVDRSVIGVFEMQLLFAIKPASFGQAASTYGRDASMGVHTNVQPQQSVVTKVTQSMQIPGSYAVAVIGTSGEKISYIRRASCAIIAIQETKGVPGEMTVKIIGSASEVHTAQQLILNFIVEADCVAQNPTAAPTGQGYYSFPSHGNVHGLPPSNPAGQVGHAPAGGGDYGTVYVTYSLSEKLTSGA